MQPAVFAVTAITRTQQHDRSQGNPTTHGMHHYRPSKIMKFSAIAGVQPILKAVMVVPCNTLKKWVNETNQGKGCGQLRIKFSAFGYATRNNGGNGRGKSQQEKELH